jgi:hypothetical protein
MHCLCVNEYYCHQVSTQLQLNIPYVQNGSGAHQVSYSMDTGVPSCGKVTGTFYCRVELYPYSPYTLSRRGQGKLYLLLDTVLYIVA